MVLSWGLGSHGGGSDEERDTPFFLWGAGINHTTNNATLNIVVGNNVTMQLHNLDQIQLAPLMSALIGLPPPVNRTAPGRWTNARWRVTRSRLKICNGARTSAACSRLALWTGLSAFGTAERRRRRPACLLAGTPMRAM